MDPGNQQDIPVRVLDPTKEVCPNYALAPFAAIRQAMTAGGAMTEEQAVQTLRDGWQEHHAQHLQAWHDQCREDQRREDEEAQRRRNEDEARLAEVRREAAEEQKALDKKKPKLATVDPSRGPPTQLRQRVPDYAREKLAKLAFVELDYFTAHSRQVAETQTRSTLDEAYTIVRNDAGLSLASVSSQRAMKGIRRDASLPFREMVIAWPVFIQTITDLPAWPRPLVKAYMDFFLEIVGHRDSQNEIGQEALMLYIEEVRMDWHEKIIAKNVTDATYDISEFAPKLYEECKAEIHSNRARALINQVCQSPLFADTH
ncbi:uncharacterized protein B0H18DRAFT_1007080 [Fomitopsis serialis]|uniref:uncharacterized protein n=1 Tax=Fomitopsis serialis TaxID=139415 RepID=UPI002008955C|nr:uncharacterized protein B0H18DRAFT_1007080 [Neoantrodia serialis]KAH9926230.1 hypothetical protein B0H18DRAFT_1007080 [Neoantrodia serialis]